MTNILGIIHSFLLLLSCIVIFYPHFVPICQHPGNKKPRPKAGFNMSTVHLVILRIIRHFQWIAAIVSPESSRRRGLPRCLSHHRAYGSVPRRFLLRVRPSGHTHFCPISTQPYLAESVRYFPALRPSFEASAQYKQQYGP